MYTLVDIVGYLISILIMLVITQFVLSLLLSFNVVSRHNQLVDGLWRGINMLLDPVLRPIQRLMPNTGAIDFSPMVLIVGLTILQKILIGLAVSSLQ